MCNKSFLISALFCLTIVPVMAQDFYVNAATGKNSNDGSKLSPFKNIQKAIDVAADGATIYVAEGNYFGTLDKGNINVTKPVTIMGGYSADFAVRDVLKYLTMVQPTPTSNGTASGQGTMNIQVKKPNTQVVIDGLIFDRGNSIGYNPKGEGQPEGVESAMMQPIGTGGDGGADLKTPEVKTKQTALLYLETISCNLTIRNCAFLNSPYYGIIGTISGGAKATITNNVFVGNKFAAVEINGGTLTAFADVHFSYNTVLFSWSRLKDLSDMGYGFRYGTRTNGFVTHNIIGLSVIAGLDRARLDSDKNRESQRKSAAENNIFFLNKQGDLTIPGGGMNMRIIADQFDDVELLTAASGNKSLTDPAAFKGAINEPYLVGFLNASYKETTDYDPNSPANIFREAMGLNKQGTIQSSATMFANRYPWRDALKLFGVMQGYGAQAIKN